MGRRLLLVALLGGCASAPIEPSNPQSVEVSGDATCAETLACFQECGGRNYGCDKMCEESATMQAQHDSATLMRCLFDHSCYDQTCAEAACGTELAICRPVIAPVSGPLVVR